MATQKAQSLVWKEISPRHVHDIHFKHVKTYLECNPIESLLDFDDEENLNKDGSRVEIRRFVKFTAEKSR